MTPDEGRLSAILEDVRTELKKREASVFLDKAKQDQFLERLRVGLQVYGSWDLADFNFRAAKFKAIQEHLDRLSHLLGALEPSERVILDIEAERTFKALTVGSERNAAANSSRSRYGRTDGASRLARLDGNGSYNTGFVLDHFQEDCALLAQAAKPVVASNPESPPAKKYHLEANVEQLIEFLGRMWTEVFNETPSVNPGAAFGSVLNDLLKALDLGKAGDKTLKRIFRM